MSVKRFLFSLRKGFSKRFRNPFRIFSLADLSAVAGKSAVTGLLPIIGYAMTIASLADFIYLLFPLQLQNPTWELQTLGSLVEQGWGFLVALALIFSRYFLENQKEIRHIELGILKGIRWLVLGLAILFILSIPLLVSDTLRLYRTIPQQIATADAAQLVQIQQIEAQLDRTVDPQIVRAIGQSVGLEPQSLQGTSLSELKSTVKNRLTAAQSSITARVTATQQQQSKQLIKSSARTLYAGLIISFTFILIWSKIGKFTRKAPRKVVKDNKRA